MVSLRDDFMKMFTQLDSGFTLMRKSPELNPCWWSPHLGSRVLFARAVHTWKLDNMLLPCSGRILGVPASLEEYRKIGPTWERTSGTCFHIQCLAWSDRGYTFLVSIQRLLNISFFFHVKTGLPIRRPTLTVFTARVLGRLSEACTQVLPSSCDLCWKPQRSVS